MHRPTPHFLCGPGSVDRTVSKFIIKSSSEFRKTFKKKKQREKKQSNAKEEKEADTGGGGRVIALQGKEKASFILFLDFMYPIPPDYHLTTDRDRLTKVLEYCDEYQAECVKARVDYILYSKVYNNCFSCVYH